MGGEVLLVRGLARRLPVVTALLALLAPGAVAAAAADPVGTLTARAAAVRVPAGFYGTWFDAMSFPPSYNRAAFAEMASMRVKVIRQYVWWDRIERSPGAYDWGTLDGVVRDAAAEGIRVLPTLLYPPTFHSSEPEGSTSNAQFPPADPATMAAFATAMVERYGPLGDFWCTVGVPGVVCDDRFAMRMWEIWNEPDYPSWWKGRPNASEYAALLTAVSAAVKRADPGAEVVLGALTGVGAATPGGFLEQLYRLGVGDAFDTIAFNPYAMSVSEMTQRIRDVRTLATRFGDAAKPFRILEYGWATGGRSSLTTVSPPCQAALLYAGTKRLAEVRKTLNIASIVQFQWQDARLAEQSTAWPHYAGVKYADGSPKPARDALAAATAGKPTPAGAGLATCPYERRAVS